MRNDEIRAVFRDCIKSILEIIQKSGKIQTHYDYTPKIDLRSRTWHLELEPRSTYPHLSEFHDELMKLPAVKRCLALMLEEDFPKHLEMEIVDKDGRPVQNPSYEPYLIYEVLGTMINKYLERYGCNFNEEKFEEIYNEMISYIYSSGGEFVLISPLENFDLEDLDEFSVDEYRIRRLNEWEIKTLMSSGYFPGPVFSPSYGTIESIYCVEGTIRTPKKRYLSPEPHIIEDFITALRLFKAGVTGINAILYYPKIWTDTWMVLSSLAPQRYALRSPKYVFEKGDLEPFVAFWNQFKKVKDQLPDNIKFSLRWFNKSYTEQEAMDRLLDLEIALEALFQGHKRLDLYLAHFIGSNKNERLKINKDIEELQKIRGAIVHSGYHKCEQEFVDLIESYYRRSMRKFLDLFPSLGYGKIIRDIKESILN
jgi:hypothetical protein